MSQVFRHHDVHQDDYRFPVKSNEVKNSPASRGTNHKGQDNSNGFTREELLNLQQQQERQAAMGPRSSSELSNDSTPKFRQLPCRTFISVGTCPYRERCVYLHDPRIICREAKTKTRRKNKEDTVVDSLFWPIMPYSQVAAKLDNNRQPHVIQNYIVPAPQSDQFLRHDQAVFSLWMHFVDFCAACSAPEATSDAVPACYQAPDIPYNAYTKSPRLEVFRALSSSGGKSLTSSSSTPAQSTHQSASEWVSKHRSASPTTVSSSMSPMSPVHHTVTLGLLTKSNLTAKAASMLPPSSLLLMTKNKLDSNYGADTSSMTSDESYTNSNGHNSIIADLDMDEFHSTLISS